MSEHVPSPADAPQLTAEELLDEIAGEGGRVFRMQVPPRVFVLTQSTDLVRRLERLGGRMFRPAHFVPSKDAPMGAYRRTPETWEWDMEIGWIPVEGNLWEAASAYRQGRKAA
jgi:hypothetical protein